MKRALGIECASVPFPADIPLSVCVIRFLPRIVNPAVAIAATLRTCVAGEDFSFRFKQRWQNRRWPGRRGCGGFFARWRRAGDGRFTTLRKSPPRQRATDQQSSECKYKSSKPCSQRSRRGNRNWRLRIAALLRHAAIQAAKRRPCRASVSVGPMRGTVRLAGRDSFQVHKTGCAGAEGES